MDKEIHIHNPDKDIVIRTGNALPLQETVALRLFGDITAPKEFFQKRGSLFGHGNKEYNIDASNIVINKKAGSVTLTIDEHSAYSGLVQGVLTINPVLEKFKVNSENFQGFTPAELAKLLRMNRQYFNVKEQFNDLVNKLQNFKAQFDTQVEESDNKRGNIANSVVKKMISEHNYNFSFFMPVYEGIDPMVIPIEVDISYSGDSTIRCHLVSVELIEYQESIKASIIEEYIDIFKDFPVIIQ